MGGSLRYRVVVGLLGDGQRREVPDLRRPIPAAADDPLPVEAETHAGDST